VKLLRHRSAGRSVIAALCAVCFLAVSPGAVPRAVAADPWETWPKKAAEPGAEQKPATAPPKEPSTEWKIWPEKPKPEMELQPAAEKKPEKGSSYGTIAWIALGVAAAIGIAFAVGGGGGGSEGGTVTNPGHQ